MKFTHQNGAFETEIEQLFIAGWTGRNAKAVAHHIKELQDIGVSPPSKTPLFYRVSASLLSQSSRIQVVGSDTSGEAEPLLLHCDGNIWLGLASDHTDRKMEALSVAASKQACTKVCAPDLWSLNEVEAHLDALILKSWIKGGGDWQLYQVGALNSILPLGQLMDLCPLKERAAMLCGTLPVLGAIRAGQTFRAELEDPLLKRSITFEYQIDALPNIS